MNIVKSSLVRASWTIILSFFLGSVFPGLVHADASLTHEVERLKRQLLTLEQNFYRGSPTSPSIPSSPQPSSMPLSGSSQMALEQEIQKLTSALEETRHTVKLQRTEIQALKNDIELRLSQLEKKKVIQEHVKEISKPTSDLKIPPVKSAPIKSSTPERTLCLPENKTPPLDPTPSPETKNEDPTPKVLTSPSSSLPDDAVTEEYNESLALLKSKDYASAQKAFSSFIKNHPNHELTGNAQFWLGEALAASGDFTQASVAFLTAYKNHPKNAKRPESLLKLAHCLGQLGKQKEACATLQKLSVDFPESSSALKRMMVEEQKSNGCL